MTYQSFLAAIEECVESAPIVSSHNEPQVYPQQYDCGCVTTCYTTDRDFLRNERPFEMRLIKACLTPDCEVMPLIAALAGDA